MDPQLKSKWTAALRSGEYKQGKRALVTPDNTYCCLGVLCLVLGRPLTETYEHYCEIYDLLGGQIEPVMHLPIMNDTGGNTFAEIADYIDANL